MAFKKDEIHVKEFSRKTKLIVVILSVAALFILVYLTWYSFVYVNPFVTLLLMIVLLVVAAVVIFSADVALYRETA
jgi:MFS superfamily sulfate permease-like transporter